MAAADAGYPGSPGSQNVAFGIRDADQDWVCGILSTNWNRIGLRIPWTKQLAMFILGVVTGSRVQLKSRDPWIPRFGASRDLLATQTPRIWCIGICNVNIVRFCRMKLGKAFQLGNTQRLHGPLFPQFGICYSISARGPLNHQWQTCGDRT